MMPYPVHYRLTVGGRYFNTESWSIGLRLAELVPDIVSDGEAEDILPLLVDPTIAYVQSQAVSANARLDFIKFNAIGSDGRQVGDSTIGVDLEQDGIGGGGPQTYPQLATVVTLRTNAQRGRASRGRFYPPGAPALQSGSGRIAAASCETLADLAATWLSAINAAAQTVNPELFVSVVSNLGSPGGVRQVTRVEVGDVVDSQRRRRDQLPENYYPAPVTL